MDKDEDRYEVIDIIVKEREGGESWFDTLLDYITQDCEGGGGDCITDNEDEDCDDHEHTPIDPCSCGLESGGGMSGTLEQCYDRQLNITKDISPLMVARALVALEREGGDHDENVRKCLVWANKEIEFEDRD